MPSPHPFKNGSLCVVGNVNRDIKTMPFPSGTHLFEDGETSVSGIVETIGGGGANSACAAARLGGRVGFIGQVGKDGVGSRIEEVLQQWGVRTALKKNPEVSTGTSINLVFEEGTRHFISSLPNNETLRFEDLDLSLLSEFRHLLRADIWFSKPMLFGGNARLFEEAQKKGMSISIDLNWDPVWTSGASHEIEARKEAVKSVMGSVDLAHGNVRELETLTGVRGITHALERLTEWGAGAVVVHLGGQGAGYYQAGEWEMVPPHPITRMVNTTGCGDVLSTCMMLLCDVEELSVKQKLEIANETVARFMEGLELIPKI